MKKKLITGIMAAMMVLGLTACSNTSGSTVSNPTNSDSKTYKVGIVKYVDDASLDQIEENVQKELDAKGQELSVKFDYEDYTFSGQADATTINSIVAQLISDEVDVIIPIATPTAQICQSATEDNKIPVVFAAVSDPVGAKLVKSMDAPGANITGTSDALNTDAMFDMMFAVNPDIKKVGLLYSKSEDASKQAIEDAKKYLDSKGVAYVEKTGTDTNEVTSAVDALVAEKVDVVFTPTDNTIMNAELTIYEKLTEAKIPHFAGADSFALNGAFLGFGVDYAGLGKETADMAVEILTGADPATTAVKTFDNGIATINTETAEKVGLDLAKVKEAIKSFVTSINETTTKESF